MRLCSNRLVSSKPLSLILSAAMMTLISQTPLSAQTATSTSPISTLAESEGKSFTALPFLWAVERSRDAEFAVSGFVPTAEFQEFARVRLKDVASDTSQIAEGAPIGFITEALAGIGALVKAEEGRVSFNGSEWALVAAVNSEEQREVVINHLRTDGDIEAWKYTVEIAEPALDIVSPYVWVVRKADDGAISSSGHVPTPQLQRFLGVRLGKTAKDKTSLAAGAPEGFITDALATSALILTITEGQAGFDGENWYVTGDTDISTMEAALASAATPVDQWIITSTKEQPVIEITPEEGSTASETETVVEKLAEEPSEEKLVEEAVTPEPEPEPEVENQTESEDNTEVDEAVSTPDEATATVKPKLYRFSGQKTANADVKLFGVVPTDDVRRYFGLIAGRVSIDGLYLFEDAPDNFVVDARAGLRALVSLNEGQLLHERDRWTLSGIAQDASVEQNIRTKIAALESSENWTLNIDQVPPIVICTEHVNELAAQNDILFNAGSARLAESSQPTIDELAVFLDECPEAIVHIEGHTDADGAENLNLVLSVARAEAVVNALIARDVSANRLYAIGYGESLPIASNDTNAGKRENRRIVFKILEEHR